MAGKKSAKTCIICCMMLLLFVSATALAQNDCKETYGDGSATVTLATGSPGELGLLKVLADKFNKTHDAKICWNKAGSGESLKLLKGKKADIIMVHAPAAEKKAVAEGWAIKRNLIGSNEFYIVGPKKDPAGIAAAKSAADAYARIAKARAKFFSRGDNSGTHKKEMTIWKNAGIQPAGKWYTITRTFMMATLKMANKEKGYFMTDSSTWVAAKKELHNLKILFRGDPILINTYHTLCQPEGATPAQPLAAAFIDFVVSEEGQKLIADYGLAKYGEGLYNDAAYARQFDH
jgi:tungstate transport system substrate-binding protein